MNVADLKIIEVDGVPLLVPINELSHYDSLALSDRAKRTKLTAKYRPDIIWQQNGTNFYNYVRGAIIYTVKIHGDSQEISSLNMAPANSSYVQPATALAKLVWGADQHMLAMRKIVQ